MRNNYRTGYHRAILLPLYARRRGLCTRSKLAPECVELNDCDLIELLSVAWISPLNYVTISIERALIDL